MGNHENTRNALGNALDPINLSDNEQKTFLDIMISESMTTAYEYFATNNKPHEQETIAKMVVFADKCQREIYNKDGDFMRSSLTDQIRTLGTIEAEAFELAADLMPETGGIANIRCVYFYKTPRDIPNNFDWHANCIGTNDMDTSEIIRGQLYEVIFPELCAETTRPFLRPSQLDISHGYPCVVLTDGDNLYWVPMDLIIELI